MAQRLTNDELADRTRVANRRRGQRMRERLVDAGRSPLTVWVPSGLRARFVNEAAAAGVNINELAERYLDAGLRERKAVLNTEPDPETGLRENQVSSSNLIPDPDPDTADLFPMEPEPQTPVVVASEPATPPVSVSFDRTAMMMTIAERVDAGLSGAAIARELTADGHRSSTGSELIGANVLREFRKWKEKNDGSASTAV